MAELRIPNTYDDRKIPAQRAFRLSNARIRGYGGAMAGGKSFALCQEAFDWMLDYPGLLLPIFRQKHTAITLTTRRTFVEQVLPSELRERKDLVRIASSQGQDFVEFRWNKSQVHFVGLDDPGKWFSSEIGGAMFDEAHEIDEEDVVTINSRLRQRCAACLRAGRQDCQHMPRRMVLTFNPSYPGHWLMRWFILGGSRSDYGYHKQAIVPDEGATIGDGDYFIARAQDNPFLPDGYVEQSLAGMPEMMRRRYLDGMWEHISGSGFFDQDALSRLTELSLTVEPLIVGEPAGDLSGKSKDDRPRIGMKKNGRMEVYKAPVRAHTDPAGEEVRAHRYVVAVDASSGASADYSAIQVLDATDWAQVAEWQGKVDPDQLAEAAFLSACVYNGAVIAPEVTGGWGFAVTKALQRLVASWAGNPAAKPRLYTRPITDRLSDRFTDVLGWDTNRKSRAHMLSLLEEALRDGSLAVHGQRTIAELAAFAFPEYRGTGDYGVPQARKGANDDLVIALAIGVAIADRMPKRAIEQGPLVLAYR